MTAAAAVALLLLLLLVVVLLVPVASESWFEHHRQGRRRWTEYRVVHGDGGLGHSVRMGDGRKLQRTTTTSKGITTYEELLNTMTAAPTSQPSRAPLPLSFPTPFPTSFPTQFPVTPPTSSPNGLPPTAAFTFAPTLEDNIYYSYYTDENSSAVFTNVPSAAPTSLQAQFPAPTASPVVQVRYASPEDCIIERNFKKFLLDVVVDLEKVTHIECPISGFTGTIPREIGRMTSLQVLNLFSNELEGSIPGSMQNLQRLTMLRLASNKLSGSIEKVNFGNMTNLVDLDLAFNQLQGTVPKSLGELSGLKFVLLGGNGFVGTIPVMENLSALYVTGNYFSDIASDKQWRQIRVLDVSENNFAGSFPKAVLQMTTLETLAMFFNNLNTEFPTELARLTNLRTLDLSNTGLGPRIPHGVFSNMTRLTRLFLERNKFSSSLPRDLDDKVAELYIFENRIHGKLDALARLTSLIALDVGDNRFENNTGIPSSISQLTYLNMFRSGLRITESELQRFASSLEGLDLTLTNSTAFSNALSDLKRLTQLRVSGDVDGTIPSEIGTLTSLIELDLHGNKLRGEAIPSSLWNLPSLTSLVLFGNSFTSITSDLKGLGELVRDPTRYVANNGSREGCGPLAPSTLSLISAERARESSIFAERYLSTNLPKLEVLDLHDNEIAHDVDEALGAFANLANLQSVDISNNRLFSSNNASALKRFTEQLRIFSDFERSSDCLEIVGSVAYRPFQRLQSANLAGNDDIVAFDVGAFHVGDLLKTLNMSNLPNVRGPVPRHAFLLSGSFDGRSSGFQGFTKDQQRNTDFSPANALFNSDTSICYGLISVGDVFLDLAVDNFTRCVCKIGYQPTLDGHSCQPCLSRQAMDQSCTLDNRNNCTCQDCGPGFFLNQVRLFSSGFDRQCVQCPVGTVQEEFGQCHGCPEGSEPNLNRTGCVVREGFWQGPEVDDVDHVYKCFAFPGSSETPCLGGNRISNFTSINRKLGSSPSSCKTGSFGVLCLACIANFTKDSSGDSSSRCVECSENSRIIVGFTILFYIFVVLLAAFSALSEEKRVRTMDKRSYWQRRALQGELSLFTIGKILLSYAQILGTLLLLPIPWTNPQITWFGFTDSLGIGGVDFKCIVEDDAYQNELLFGVLFAPCTLLFLALIIATWHNISPERRASIRTSSQQLRKQSMGIIMRRFETKDRNVDPNNNQQTDDMANTAEDPMENRETLRRRIAVASAASLLTLHYFCTKQALLLLACFEFDANGKKFTDGSSFLESDPSKKCWTGAVGGWQAFALIALFVYGFGIPIGIYYLIRSGDYHFLCTEYKDEWRYWDLAIVMRKGLFLAAAILFTKYGTSVVIVLCAGVVFFAGLFHFHILPFRNPFANLLEGLGLVVIFITILLGTFVASLSVGTPGKRTLGGVAIFLNLAYVCLYFIAFADIFGVLPKKIGQYIPKPPAPKPEQQETQNDSELTGLTHGIVEQQNRDDIENNRLSERYSAAISRLDRFNNFQSGSVDAETLIHEGESIVQELEQLEEQLKTVEPNEESNPSDPDPENQEKNPPMYHDVVKQ